MTQKEQQATRTGKAIDSEHFYNICSYLLVYNHFVIYFMNGGFQFGPKSIFSSYFSWTTLGTKDNSDSAKHRNRKRSTLRKVLKVNQINQIKCVPRIKISFTTCFHSKSRLAEREGGHYLHYKTILTHYAGSG